MTIQLLGVYLGGTQIRAALANSDGVMERLAAGLYFGAFVMVVVAVGWILVERRDA